MLGKKQCTGLHNIGIVYGGKYMVKLTSKKLEQIVKEKTGKDATYLGIFVDDNNKPIKPVCHGFATWPQKKLKLLSVKEKQLIESLKD